MNDNEKLEDIIKKHLDVRAGNGTHDRMRDVVLDAHEHTREAGSATALIRRRSILMRNPIIKLSAAAVVVAAVLVGISLFRDSGSGIAWAEVAERTKASQGVIYRNRSTVTRSNRGDNGADHCVCYLSATRSRHDTCEADEISRSIYCDFDTKTIVLVGHDTKTYAQQTMDEQTLREQHGAWANPSRWVQEFLSKDYTELGQKMIDGVLCEGIETTDPTFGMTTFPVDRLMARVWVSVETGYPVLLEADIVGDNGQLRITGTLDQFQWDVDLDESLFEPNIPDGYVDISPD